MKATITKVQISDNPMKGFFAKRRGETVKMVDAWNVEGEIDGRPYDIQTRDENRAKAYAAAIDEGDEESVKRMLGD